MRVERWRGEAPPDEAQLRQRLEREGYSVYASTDAPGATYSAHSHGDDQSHWVLRGALALTVDGTEYVLERGDRDWLPAGMVHSARVVGTGPVTYLIGSRSPNR